MYEPSVPDYRAVIRQHFGHISKQSSSGTTVIGGLMPYLGAFNDDPDRVLILSGADTSNSMGGKLLALSRSLIAAWTFGFDGDEGGAFSLHGPVVAASALSRVEVLPESTAFMSPFVSSGPEARPVAALHIDGAGVFTVGYRQEYRWATTSESEEELRVFRDVLSRTR